MSMNNARLSEHLPTENGRNEYGQEKIKVRAKSNIEIVRHKLTFSREKERRFPNHSDYNNNAKDLYYAVGRLESGQDVII